MLHDDELQDMLREMRDTLREMRDDVVLLEAVEQAARHYVLVMMGKREDGEFRCLRKLEEALNAIEPLD